MVAVLADVLSRGEYIIAPSICCGFKVWGFGSVQGFRVKGVGLPSFGFWGLGFRV